MRIPRILETRRLSVACNLQHPATPLESRELIATEI